MRPFVCAPILKSRQTCHRAVSPSIAPCCCLRILLCYLLPGCVTSTHSLNSGIVTLTFISKVLSNCGELFNKSAYNYSHHRHVGFSHVSDSAFHSSFPQTRLQES